MTDKEEYVYQNANDTVQGRCRPDPGAPSEVAAEFVAEWIGERLVWRGDFYTYTGTRWAKEDERDVMGEINRELMDSYYQKWVKDAWKDYPWHPNNTSLANLKTQLMLQAALPSSVEPVRGGEFIFMENGRYVIMTGMLLEHDPSIFNLHAVPFAFDPEAQCPRWDRFIDETFAGDEVAIEIHYRWMATELMAATDLQKAYMLLGERRSGKGTLMRIGDALAGIGQTTAMSLRDFAKGFGMRALIGKNVCRINEMVDPGLGAAAAVEYLLSIVGGDSVQVDIKLQDPWVGQLPVLFTLSGNEIPRLPDAGGALTSRMILNRTAGTREGKQDPGLAGKIIGDEMPGVLNRVLAWVDKVYDAWPVNERVAGDIQSMRDGGSPVRAWLEDPENELRVGPMWAMPRKEAFVEFASWAHENGHGRMSNATFGRHLSACVPNLGAAQVGGKNSQVRHYTGFGKEELLVWTDVGWQVGKQV